MKVFDGAVELFEHIWLRSNHLHTHNIFQSQAGLSGGGGAKVQKKGLGLPRVDEEGKKKKKKLYRRKIILGKSQKIGFGALQVIWRSPEEEEEEKGLSKTGWWDRLFAWGKEIVRENPA